jgi:S1-C subfamily serine protease
MRVGNVVGIPHRRPDLDHEHGVIVVGVQCESPAAEVGLRAGDVLMELNREPIADTVDLDARLDSVGEEAFFLVRCGSGTLFVALRRGATPIG